MNVEHFGRVEISRAGQTMQTRTRLPHLLTLDLGFILFQSSQTRFVLFHRGSHYREITIIVIITTTATTADRRDAQDQSERASAEAMVYDF